MADTSITPYGYIYGKEPKAHHPFWGGSGRDIEEYVKSLNGTVTETENGKLYTINATDGDDVVTKVIDILVPNVETPEIPTDYVTSVAIQKVEATNQDSYYFTYYTKDGESHGFGTMVIRKDYVSSVDVTGEESSGVNTITIDVDGDEASFDVPTQYVKSVVQSEGQHEDDVYTFTDENGHTTKISAPGQYLQSADVSINGGSTELSARGVVGSSAATSRLMNITMTAAEDHPDNLNEIVITNAAGDTSKLQWGNGESGPTLSGYKKAIISGSFSTTSNPLNVHVDLVRGILNGQNMTINQVTFYIDPQEVLIPEDKSSGYYLTIGGNILGIFSSVPTFTPKTEYASHAFTITGRFLSSPIRLRMTQNDTIDSAYYPLCNGIAIFTVHDSTDNIDETFVKDTQITTNRITSQSVVITE